MKWLLRIVIAFSVSFVITMAMVVAGFIMAMFSTMDAGVRKFGLFGAIFFEAHEQPSGATAMEIGVADGTPIAIIFGIGFLFCLAVTVMLEKLKLRKKQLLQTQ
ncbi:hypothetical protein FQP90_00725 [Paenarthrobacter nitroguajacolicus]|uniref:Uncharacterized protein n=1 Tax=Paenarthrobacter nitroguajacolicus TaxID=211146 RepID=A0A558HC45_PAENT|nr:hypothetical protein [Paenarthrobacter nitroguajacolicus]TVU66699.1 hypothetical protein FQP90_00725 [Paenarthrobacter nitroguajacolicus]